MLQSVTHKQDIPRTFPEHPSFRSTTPNLNPLLHKKENATFDEVKEESKGKTKSITNDEDKVNDDSKENENEKESNTETVEGSHDSNMEDHETISDPSLHASLTSSSTSPSPASSTLSKHNQPAQVETFLKLERILSCFCWAYPDTGYLQGKGKLQACNIFLYSFIFISQVMGLSVGFYCFCWKWMKR